MPHTGFHKAGLLLAAAWLGCLGPAPPACGQADVTNEQVQNAIRRATAYLRANQLAGGGWGGRGHYRAQGMNALAALALLNAGVSPDDAALSRVIDQVANYANEYTYVVALKCQVLAAADPAKYMPPLRTAAAWLQGTQLSTGMWPYSRQVRGRGDNSNTQFALLGLHEAAKAGVHVDPNVWFRSRKHFENTQNGDGGWYYTARGRSYGSMSVAGLASLYICGQRLHVGAGPSRFHNGIYLDCGKYQQNRAIAAGIRWITDNFSVRQNPGRGATWLYYYLYGLERCGMVSGLRNFGAHDWYRQGAAFLVGAQGPDGRLTATTYDTAFGLLFLAKGNRPVLYQKLTWSPNSSDWNRNVHDLENLTNFIDDKLGERTTWQSASLDLSVQQLRVSPILFITGHHFPAFTDEEKAKLRRYVDTGGTLLCEACCTSKAFADGFRRFAKEVFPEYSLRALAPHHPVFSSFYRLKETYGLEGIDVGCRTSVFLSVNPLSCLWELETVKVWSDRAFMIGTNLAAYATGKEKLQNKLDVVELPPEEKARQAAEVPRGAVRIARLIHDGGYNSDPHAMENLAALLRDKAKIDVVSKARHLRADDEKIYEYPVVFMHGHFTFALPDKQIEGLRKYLEKGGVLIADACCGQKAFDASFRAMVKKVFPDHPLTPLPRDHPIIDGRAGVELGELQYRRILADELKAAGVADFRGTTHPSIEAVTLDGRTVILYSKYDWSCGLEGDKPYSCRGYVDEAAKKLAMNLFLYAISY